jgi:hypothetical protein
LDINERHPTLLWQRSRKRFACEKGEGSKQSDLLPPGGSKKRASDEANGVGEVQKKLKVHSELEVDDLALTQWLKVGLRGQPGQTQ